MRMEEHIEDGLNMDPIRENENRYYMNPDRTMYTGWHKEKNSWYYYNQYGKAHKGWLQEGDKWYYMDPNLDGLKDTESIFRY